MRPPSCGVLARLQLPPPLVEGGSALDLPRKEGTHPVCAGRGGHAKERSPGATAVWEDRGVVWGKALGASCQLEPGLSWLFSNPTAQSRVAGRVRCARIRPLKMKIVEEENRRNIRSVPVILLFLL